MIKDSLIQKNSDNPDGLSLFFLVFSINSNNYLKTNEFKYFASTVMPGQQLKQAIPFSKKVREQFPEIKIIWGGYFASNQYKSAINSGFVDYIINGPGDKAFLELISAVEKGNVVSSIENLIYKKIRFV